MASNLVVGTWNLIAVQLRLADGKILYPLGEDCKGQLMYDDRGNMSGQLMRSGRPKFESETLFTGAPEEIAAAYNGYLAYYGKYRVDESRHMVIHTVKGSLFPNWIGKRQERIYIFWDDQLILSTPPLPAGDTTGTGVLKWRRAKAADD